MAKITEEYDERIVEVSIAEELADSFLEYSVSVIYARALPDARDGLKPVQRRILYTMDNMGLRPDKSHVKCARVVGNVMGELHPHGDSAIYDALVRLAQPWSQRLTTVDGHGNFGSLDSVPAAMRYTECRLAPGALLLTTGLDEDTVDLQPNYDGKSQEPLVLPAAFPNLLVNGATGIAVGMATNIAPHNLLECIQGLKFLMKNPQAEISELMNFIPGPDLPSGGKIIGLEGIAQAYETGKGSFLIRATARVEQVTPRRKGIVITELPYLVGPEKVMDEIKKLVQNKKLTGIADVKDLTDLNNGTRLVIEVKNGINPDALLEQLYKLTSLESSFAINSVALVHGQPKTMNLKEMLQVFLDHRLEVVRRRSEYRLAKAENRLHLVEGLLLAIVDIDDVIAIIRSSSDAAEARARLIEVFDLTEVQANYILDMQLRRLTKFSKIELDKEKAELLDNINYLRGILENDELLAQLVCEELDTVAKEHGTPRRTVLLASAGVAVTAATPLEVPDGPCQILLSSTGLLARLDSAEVLVAGETRSAHDVLVSSCRTTVHGSFGILTNHGRILRMSALDLPVLPTTATIPNLAGGSLVTELVSLAKGERALAVTSLTEQTFGWALGTARGIVKRVNPEILSNKDEWEIIRLEAGDEVIGALELIDDTRDFVFITTAAQLLHFPVANVRPQGRSGGGIAGIKLAPGDKVLFFGLADPEVSAGDLVVTIAGTGDSLPGTEAGLLKVTPLAEYPAKGRATGGVRCQRFLKGINRLLLAWAGPAPAAACSGNGNPVQLPELDIRRDGSGIAGTQPISGIGTAGMPHN